jgi:hypothetical protein
VTREAWTAPVRQTAYDACEAATVLFQRKFGPAIRAKAASPAAMLPMLAKLAGLLPSHTRRSDESQALQQFSTPIALGLAASTAAAITVADRVLEPSAGTGLLAILAELDGLAMGAANVVFTPRRPKHTSLLLRSITQVQIRGAQPPIRTFPDRGDLRRLWHGGPGGTLFSQQK